MNGLTMLLWITILIIGIIAIIAVKLHYKGAELENDERSIISKDTIGGILSRDENKESDTPQTHFTQPTDTYPIEEVSQDNFDGYIEPIVENNNYKNIEYKSQNQVLINYDNEVKKTQEPMTQKQVEIMTPDNEKHELKDLFTIDELIKESKRKDSEREKESQQIQKDDEDLTEIKESIRQRKENEDVEEKLIEEILADEEIVGALNNEEAEVKTEPTIQDIIEEQPTEEIVEEKTEPTIQDIIEEQPTEEIAEVQTEPTIQDIIEEQPTEEIVEEKTEPTIQDVLDVEDTPETQVEEETPVVSQKEIAEAIDNASQEKEEEIESISESENITETLLNSEEEIKEPVLKSPTKIEEKTEDLSSPIDDRNLFESKEVNDLDYRKDLAKITNTIKGSRLFQDVKEKLKGPSEPEIDPLDDIQESYIRNVNDFEEYDEYEPIINETHDEFGEVYEPDYDQAIREENTRRLLNKVEKAPEPELAIPKVDAIKPKPSRDNIKIQLGNADIVLKKGDEIIFRHDGETYSSQVYAINGDDISVRYRRKNITIKPEDVKKIY